MRDAFSAKCNGNLCKMLLRRMAIKPFLLSALWLTTSPMVALAGSGSTFALSSEIAALVPSCAAGCFKMFLEANYSPQLCGSQPSLQCLCPHAGISGFTMGEGALSCLVLENDRGACAGMGVSSKVATRAYAMCNGQPNAAPATHSTIQATLVLPSNSRTPPSAVPTSLPSTLLTATRPSTLTPTATQVQPTLVVPTSTVTSSPAAAGTTPINRGTLSGAQIAGIALGAAGAVVVMMAILVLARGCRQRRENKVGTFNKMRDSWSLSRKSDWSPQMLQISAPVNLRRPDVDPSRKPRTPPDRNAGRTDAIGLAISPLGGLAAAAAIPQSRLKAADQAMMPRTVTPPKPALTLTIPQNERRLQPPAAQTMPFMGRDSVVTEFAEDGDMDSREGTQIWRPPASSDPLSATTYYVADKWGNWVLGNSNRRSRVAELEGSSPAGPPATKDVRRYPPPASQAPGASAAAAAASTAPVMMPSKPAPAQLGPAIQFRPQVQTSQIPLSRSSSVYSNYSLPSTVTPGPSNPMPRTLPPPNSYEQMMQNAAASRQQQQQSGPPRRKSSKGLDRSDSKVSEMSVTTIASSTADAAEYASPEALEQSNLSPVVESPRSAGVSPVTYPRIRGRLSDNKLTLFPPPALGDMRRSPPSGGSPVAARRQHPVPLDLTPSRKPLPRNPAEVMLESPTPAPLRVPSNQAPPHLSQHPLFRQQQQQPPPPPHQAWIVAGRQSPVFGPGPMIPPRVTSQERSSTPTSHASTSSSLLAKRLGAERAAALLLASSEAKPGQAGKWKRQPTPGSGFMLSPEVMSTPPRAGAVDAYGIPRSPAWQPKLTPTRRGEDLYLNVQSGLSDH